jgi:hypothetical protein
MMGSTIYYGAKGDYDKLDTSQPYNKGEADFSGTTSCKNSIFGDPLPGTNKFCFCEEVSSAIHPVAERCSGNDEYCGCDSGNVVYYAAGTNLNGEKNSTTSIDFTRKHF